jgi:RNA polymerase sigma-70 factor, ECF subfamily
VNLNGPVHCALGVERAHRRLMRARVSDENRTSENQDLQDIESTLELLKRAHQGDRTAVEVLIERCVPPLRRWAHGRLPQYARSEYQTEDLVQEAVLRVLRRLDTFESRRVGALQAFLRQTVRNLICDEIRKVRHRNISLEIPDEIEDEQLSALETLIAKEQVERYEMAMKRLQSVDRELIVARFEMGLAFDDVAVATGRPTAAAARMAVTRAMSKLAAELNPGG